MLIIHAPNFWKWFIGPAVLYFAERILRLRIVNRARYGKTIIEEGITLPSKVFRIVLVTKYRVEDILNRDRLSFSFRDSNSNHFFNLFI